MYFVVSKFDVNNFVHLILHATLPVTKIILSCCFGKEKRVTQPVKDITGLPTVC